MALTLFWTAAALGIGANDYIFPNGPTTFENVGSPSYGAGGAIIGAAGALFDANEQSRIYDHLCLDPAEGAIGVWFNATANGSFLWSQGASWTENIGIAVNLGTGAVAFRTKADATGDSQIVTADSVVSTGTDYFAVARWRAVTNERELAVYDIDMNLIGSASSGSSWTLPTGLGSRLVFGSTDGNWAGKVDSVFVSTSFDEPIEAYAKIANYAQYGESFTGLPSTMSLYYRTLGMT